MDELRYEILLEAIRRIAREEDTSKAVALARKALMVLGEAFVKPAA